MSVQLLTVTEVGKRLGVGRVTVWRHVKNGHLRVVDVATGGTRPCLRIREDDLQAFVDSKTYDSGPAAAAARQSATEASAAQSRTP
jgi:excisionase family DNA binding protein